MKENKRLRKIDLEKRIEKEGVTLEEMIDYIFDKRNDINLPLNKEQIKSWQYHEICKQYIYYRKLYELLYI